MPQRHHGSLDSRHPPVLNCVTYTHLSKLHVVTNADMARYALERDLTP